MSEGRTTIRKEGTQATNSDNPTLLDAEALRRILVVDDDMDFALSLQDILLSRGYGFKGS